ncbi:MAG TPA: AAA family ATPase, partial [Opitutales bacterium]|nr:AAA family ATPase [Opitutales bacterium]
ERLVEREHVRREGDSVQTVQMYHHEKAIARHMKRIIAGPSGLPAIIIEKAIPWAEAQVKVSLAEQQREALERALSSKISIITGGPGTGKTTMLKALVRILGAKQVGMVLAAPTGRAAQRMHESTGHAAQTIHRLLKYEPGSGRFVHREGNPIHGEFFVVDEASMLDTALAAALLAAIPAHAHLVIVGDIYQLPSVGPGQVLRDWIDSELTPVTRLTAIYRQTAGSAIVSLAHEILEGHSEAPSAVASLERVDPGKELHFIHAPDGASAQHILVELCTRYFPKWYPQDHRTGVQILAPMHRGEVGTVALNRMIQQAVNPHGHALPGIPLRVGDRVIQTRNLYEKNVFNGDLGVIEAVDPDAVTLTADFEREVVTFERLELGDLQLAYAISVHKSQGSEFPIVVIPLLKEHYIMLQRNLLYTAITRSRHKVFLIGDPAAYTLAVRKAEATRRHTRLLEKLLKP